MWVEGWKKWSRSQAFSSLSTVKHVRFLLRSGGSVDAEILEFGESFEPVARALAADAGLFPAAEGDRRAGDLDPVDRDHAELERAGEALLARAVVGDDIGDKTVFRGIGARR